MNSKVIHVQEGLEVRKDIIERFKLKSGDLRGSKNNVIDFTGLVMNHSQVLISWPKNYFTHNDLNSSRVKKQPEKLFNLLLEHIEVLEDSKFNDEGFVDDKAYPLKEFKGVLEYYLTYGLYYEENKRIKDGFKGKINWKKTMSKSSKIISKGNLLYTPFQVEVKSRKTVLLSECMAFIINETLDMLSFLLPQYTKVNYQYNRKKFEKTQYILRRLIALRNEIFKDTEKKLLKNITSFFMKIGNIEGLNYKAKNFNLIWEIIVEKHLNNNLLIIKDDKFEFSKGCLKFNFKKKFFKIGTRTIEVDHYFESEDNVYILDSKYYDNIRDLDYKQVAYDYFLRKEKKENINILVIPSYENSIKEHFCYPTDNVKIIEYHFSIKEIIEEYL